jgi:hypothetical protein
MTMGTWGWDQGTNTSYYLLWANSESEARTMLPENVRGDADLVQLNQISGATGGRMGQTGQMVPRPAGQKQYLVFLSQSRDEHQSTMDEMRSTGRPMTMGNWGYEESTNTSYFVVWANSESEARDYLPSQHRDNARIVELTSISGTGTGGAAPTPGGRQDDGNGGRERDIDRDVDEGVIDTTGTSPGGDDVDADRFDRNTGTGGLGGTGSTGSGSSGSFRGSGTSGTSGTTGSGASGTGASGSGTSGTGTNQTRSGRSGDSEEVTGSGASGSGTSGLGTSGTTIDGSDNPTPGSGPTDTTYAPRRDENDDQPRTSDEVEISPQDRTGGMRGDQDERVGTTETSRQYLVILNQPQSELQESMDNLRQSGQISEFGRWGHDEQTTYFIVTGGSEQEVMQLLPEENRADAQVLLLSPLSQPNMQERSPDLDRDKDGDEREEEGEDQY